MINLTKARVYMPPSSITWRINGYMGFVFNLSDNYLQTNE